MTLFTSNTYLYRGDLVVSFGDQTLTGKDAVCTEFCITGDSSINRHSIFEATFTFKFIDCEWVDLFNGSSVKIRDKKVKDCSIQELLFAVRSKLKKD